MSMDQMEIKGWGEKEVREFLEKEGLERWKKLFEDKKITGVDLQNLDHLEKIGIETRGDRLTIRNAVIKFLGKKSPSKVLNDPIHGLIELHPLLIKIMDTPQFQRLRYIKQLGGAYFVYPGASHNRFEHSVGVAHLAGELARALSSKQPELKIDERDILCVQIAGLCHDLGHGPFSHLYDGIFIPKACGETQWKHEDASLCMFDHLVEENGLKPLMELYDLNPYGKEENDLVFIKEMIQGKPPTEAKWPYKGRTEEKSFLYEIVANKLNGIDVDKFDYLARDAYHLGMQSNFDHKRFIMLARVCEVEEETKKSKKPEETNQPEKPEETKQPEKPEETKQPEKPEETKQPEKPEENKQPEKPEETKQRLKPKKFKKHICSRDKEVGNLYDMFHTRYCLHRRVCQHKTHKAIELMIRDAFLKADEHIKTEGSRGEMFKLSTAKDDMEAYTKLTDQVFERILHPCSSSCPELKEASKILQRIVSRNLYKFVGETKIPKKIGAWKGEVAQDHANDENQADNIEITIVTFDYGKEEEDPINNTYFYSKCNPNKGFKILENQKSKLLPANFSETIMRVYCKNAENINLEGARKAFEDWCSKNGFAVPEDQDIAVQGKQQ